MRRSPQSLTILLSLAILAIFLPGCGKWTSDVRVVGDVVIPNGCDPAIDFNGRTYDIQGVKLPLQYGGFSLPIEIGKFYTEKKQLVQDAMKIAVILDSRRVANCELLQQMQQTPADQRTQLILTYQRDNERIHQLALLVAMPCPDCVQEWIKAYASLANEVNQKGGKGTASPQLEQLVNLDAFVSAMSVGAR